MAERKFGQYSFQLIEEIRPDSDDSGFIEYTFPAKPGIRPNRYAEGPFCRFQLIHTPSSPGVYALTTGNDLQYLGECGSLAARFGPTNYGRIAARNIHADGQATNCKINALILKAAKAGLRISLWFHASLDRKTIEVELIDRLRPPWNGRIERIAGSRGSDAISKSTIVQNRREPSAHATAEIFRSALEQEFIEASARGDSYVRVRAGELHRQIGGYPGPDHRLPTCCSVMRSMMSRTDLLVKGPAKGKGATLTVEYKLPRP